MARIGKDSPGYKTRFGQPGGPKSGRPVGAFGGRHAALMTLDKVMAEVGNQEKLKLAFQEAIDDDVLKFFRRYIMPLLPKEAIVKLGGEDEILDYLGNLLVARDEVIAARKEAKRDNGGKRSPRRSRA